MRRGAATDSVAARFGDLVGQSLLYSADRPRRLFFVRTALEARPSSIRAASKSNHSARRKDRERRPASTWPAWDLPVSTIRTDSKPNPGTRRAVRNPTTNPTRPGSRPPSSCSAWPPGCRSCPSQRGLDQIGKGLHFACAAAPRKRQPFANCSIQR